MFYVLSSFYLIKKMKLTKIVQTTLVGLVFVTSADAKPPADNYLIATTYSTSKQSEELDTLIHLDGKSGAKMVFSSSTPVSTDDPTTLSFGVKTPLLDNKVKLSLAYNTDTDGEIYSGIGFLDVPLTEGLSLKVGAYGVDSVYGFAEAKVREGPITFKGKIYQTENDVKVDASLSLKSGPVRTRVNVRSEGAIGASLGITDGDFGANIRVSYNHERESVNSRITIVPAGYEHQRRHDTRRDNFSSRSEMNQAGMILKNPTPFEAMATDGETGHLVITGGLRDTPKKISGSGTIYVRPIPELALGSGVKLQHDKKKDTTVETVELQLIAEIPHTPISAFVDMDYSLQTEQMGATGGLVISGNF
jgi:hypothetical protein